MRAFLYICMHMYKFISWTEQSFTNIQGTWLLEFWELGILGIHLFLVDSLISVTVGIKFSVKMNHCLVLSLDTRKCSSSNNVFSYHAFLKDEETWHLIPPPWSSGKYKKIIVAFWLAYKILCNSFDTKSWWRKISGHTHLNIYTMFILLLLLYKFMLCTVWFKEFLHYSTALYKKNSLQFLSLLDFVKIFCHPENVNLFFRQLAFLKLADIYGRLLNPCEYITRLILSFM